MDGFERITGVAEGGCAETPAVLRVVELKGLFASPAGRLQARYRRSGIDPTR